MTHSIYVRVPASTSNLGPGFDALGLALSLSTIVEVTPAATTEITISGEGAEQLSRGPDNLLYQGMQALARHCGAELPPVHLHITNGIPLERGIGASGAASLAGLLAANALLEAGLDRRQILDLACQFEGHPDNVAPSLLGGCTIAAVADGHVSALQIPIADDLICVLCIPNVRMPTKAARRVLPETYSCADVVFNLSRTGLLVAALATRQYESLRVAVEDRMHQPYRALGFPALPAVIQAAHGAGAYGAFLSGAGSTIAALANPAQAKHVVQAMVGAAAQHDLDCRALIAQIDHTGAMVGVNAESIITPCS